MTLDPTHTLDRLQNSRRPIDSITRTAFLAALLLTPFVWSPIAHGQAVASAVETSAEAPPAPTMTDAERLEAGTHLLAEVIAAHGGDAFVSQRSQISHGKGLLRPAGQAQAGQVPSITVTKVFPEKNHVAMTLSPGALTQGFDGTAGWVQSIGANGESTMADLTEVFTKRQDFGFDILRRSDVDLVARKLDDEVANDIAWERLEVELPAGQRTRFYFEPGKRLISMVIYVLDGETVTEAYSNYREVEGVHVPHRIELFQRKAKVLEFEVTSVEINPEVDPALFSRPAS